MIIPMIPTTHKLWIFTGTRRPLFALLGILSISLTSVSGAVAQSSSTPSNSSSSQPGSSMKNDPAQKSPSPPPAKSHKVITNDDPEFQHTIRPRSSGDNTPQRGRNFLLSCDLDCERQAKDLLAYGPDREADWQMQVVGARSALAKDDAWRGMLWHVIQQSELYCNFLNQQSHLLAPTGTDFNSRVERARQEQSSREMAHSLQQSLDAALGVARGHIQELSDLFPVRAAMMQVQLSRIGDLTCEELRQQQ
jgi:hypothetical protein